MTLFVPQSAHGRTAELLLPINPPPPELLNGRMRGQKKKLLAWSKHLCECWREFCTFLDLRRGRVSPLSRQALKWLLWWQKNHLSSTMTTRQALDGFFFFVIKLLLDFFYFKGYHNVLRLDKMGEPRVPKKIIPAKYEQKQSLHCSRCPGTSTATGFPDLELKFLPPTEQPHDGQWCEGMEHEAHSYLESRWD